MKIVLELTEAERQKLQALLHDAAVDSEDEGRQGNPDARLLWKVYKQLGEKP